MFLQTFVHFVRAEINFVAVGSPFVSVLIENARVLFLYGLYDFVFPRVLMDQLSVEVGAEEVFPRADRAVARNDRRRHRKEQIGKLIDIGRSFFFGLSLGLGRSFFVKGE